jgi:hypothetical protein
MKHYHFNGLAGCVVQRRSRTTQTMVGVYVSEQAGLEQGRDVRWTTVCETHGMLVSHSTRADAMHHAADPSGWCDECRKPVFEVWSSRTGDQITVAPLDRIREMRGQGLLKGHHASYSIRAEDFDAAMKVHYEIKGFAPYKPME